jgi:hypothetical protein
MIATAQTFTIAAQRDARENEPVLAVRMELGAILAGRELLPAVIAGDADLMEALTHFAGAVLEQEATQLRVRTYEGLCDVDEGTFGAKLDAAYTDSAAADRRRDRCHEAVRVTALKAFGRAYGALKVSLELV